MKLLTKFLLLCSIFFPVTSAAAPPRVMFGVVTENSPLPGGGVLVIAVRPESPADNAGIAASDVILSLNGSLVSSREDVRSELKKMTPGQELSVQLLRSGQVYNKKVLMVERPDPSQQTVREKQESQVERGVPSGALHMHGSLPSSANRPSFKAPRAHRMPVGNAQVSARYRDSILEKNGKTRSLRVKSEIRAAMNEHRKKVLEHLAAMPEGFVPGEVSDHLQAIRHLARDANQNTRGWMKGEAGEVSLQFKEGDFMLELHGASNKLTLTVSDEQGNVVSELPLNTLEERAAVPSEIIECLRRLR